MIVGMIEFLLYTEHSIYITLILKAISRGGYDHFHLIARKLKLREETFPLVTSKEVD